jgi:hypothetical protein
MWGERWRHRNLNGVGVCFAEGSLRPPILVSVELATASLSEQVCVGKSQ